MYKSSVPTQEKGKSPLVLKLEELFGIDHRSLAIFRMGLGLLILGDLIARSVDLRTFYTDAGVLPRAALAPWPSWAVPIHMFNGGVAFQTFLFLLTGLLALALTLGLRTRLVNFFCWLLMTSLHARNPLVAQAGDILLYLFLFWGMFLPLGARWSLDRVRAPQDQTFPTRVLSGGSIALLFQVCIVYVFASINKTGSLWRDGSALTYVFHNETIVSSVGVFLLGYPRLLKSLTYFTLWLEKFGPILAFVPIATGMLRMVVILFFVAFHLGMALTLNLGAFPYLCILGWMLFLPREFWERLPEPRIQWRSKTWLGKMAGGRPIKVQSHWATQVLAIFFIVYILLLNLATMNLNKFRPVFILNYKWMGDLLHLDQAWAMFGPDPSLEVVWYVIPGKLGDGTEIDAHGKLDAVRWEKPQPVSEAISNLRWRKYLNSLAQKRSSYARFYYGQYLCRQWNSKHPQDQALKSLSIYLLRERISPIGLKPPPEKALLWEGSCLGSET